MRSGSVGQVLSSTLIDRDREQAALGAALDRARGGSGAMLFLVGEGGMGKSPPGPGGGDRRPEGWHAGPGRAGRGRAATIIELAPLGEADAEALVATLALAGTVDRVFEVGRRVLESLEAQWAPPARIAAPTSTSPAPLIRALHELGTIDLINRTGIDRLLEAQRLALRAGALGMALTLDLQILGGPVARNELEDGCERATAVSNRPIGWGSGMWRRRGRLGRPGRLAARGARLLRGRRPAAPRPHLPGVAPKGRRRRSPAGPGGGGRAPVAAEPGCDQPGGGRAGAGQGGPLEPGDGRAHLPLAPDGREATSPAFS